MKYAAYLSLLFVAAALAGVVWTVRVHGADGSPLAIAVPLGLAGLNSWYSHKRTGKWFTNQSGGY